MGYVENRRERDTGGVLERGRKSGMKRSVRPGIQEKEYMVVMEQYLW